MRVKLRGVAAASPARNNIWSPTARLVAMAEMGRRTAIMGSEVKLQFLEISASTSAALTGRLPPNCAFSARFWDHQLPGIRGQPKGNQHIHLSNPTNHC